MRNIIVLTCLLASTNLFAQDADTTYWKKSFKGSLNLNQAAFSDNWTSGGVNSFGLNTLIKKKQNF
jgi:hypothetical protein